MIVNARASVKTTAQTILFHSKIFKPSSMAKGMTLNKAIQALKVKLQIAIEVIGLAKWAIGNEMMERIMFVNGPATAVFPIISLFAEPAIITAPGAIILKKLNGIIESKVKRTPNKIKRNSAHNP